MLDVFEQFESDVMYKIISENNEISDELVKQYKNAKVVSREFTGVGFYTNFMVSNENLRLKDNFNVEMGNVQAELDGLKYGAGFVLFIRDGFIKSLEGYTYDEPWPKRIINYSFE
ncbi:MAG: hypothetical protein ACOYJD_03465 [Christensenellales bacterium]|jgi:hypothetical protein